MIDTVIFDIGNVLTEWHWHNSFVEWFGVSTVAITDAGDSDILRTFEN